MQASRSLQRSVDMSGEGNSKKRPMEASRLVTSLVQCCKLVFTDNNYANVVIPLLI